jgi:hypothetical protein
MTEENKLVKAHPSMPDWPDIGVIRMPIRLMVPDAFVLLQPSA